MLLPIDASRLLAHLFSSSTTITESVKWKWKASRLRFRRLKFWDQKEIKNVVKDQQAPPSIVHGVQLAEEFTPVEHPFEPPDNDQPVRCPLPEPCIIHDGILWKERLQLSIKKRNELSYMKESGVEASRRRRYFPSSEHSILPSMSAPANAISQLLDS